MTLLIDHPLTKEQPPAGLSRRGLLVVGAAGAAGVAGLWGFREFLAARAAVFVARNQRYDGPLKQTIRDGLLASGVTPSSFRGKKVLLKPNLVEPIRDRPHMTTHPAVVVAAAEALRTWGAFVTVGEAPGHVRDTEMALVESGVQGAGRRRPALRGPELRALPVCQERRPPLAAEGILFSAVGRGG